MPEVNTINSVLLTCLLMFVVDTAPRQVDVEGMQRRRIQQEVV